MKLSNGRETVTTSFIHLLSDLYPGRLATQVNKIFLWPIQTECLLLTTERILITSVPVPQNSLDSFRIHNVSFSSLLTKPIFLWGGGFFLLQICPPTNELPIQVVLHSPLSCYQFPVHPPPASALRLVNTIQPSDDPRQDVMPLLYVLIAPFIFPLWTFCL